MHTGAKAPRRNKLHNLAAIAALLRCAPLAVLALRRAARLASPPAMAAKLHNLFLRGALAGVPSI